MLISNASSARVCISEAQGPLALAAQGLVYPKPSHSRSAEDRLSSPTQPSSAMCSVCPYQVESAQDGFAAAVERMMRLIGRQREDDELGTLSRRTSDSFLLKTYLSRTSFISLPAGGLHDAAPQHERALGLRSQVSRQTCTCRTGARSCTRRSLRPGD